MSENYEWFYNRVGYNDASEQIAFLSWIEQFWSMVFFWSPIAWIVGWIEQLVFIVPVTFMAVLSTESAADYNLTMLPEWFTTM